MVVMQHIPDASLLRASLPLPTSALEVDLWDVTQTLELLHAQYLVFGDLREANVLYLPGDVVVPCVLILMVFVGMEKTGTPFVLTLVRSFV